tara:strand:- start:1283 stop:1795 length:513 start_codon:yes stop_codon:yes gene_type:complete
MEDDYDLKKLSKKKPKRVNSRRKGGNFARKIANMLNDRFETKEFSKTPGSGAYATTHSLPEYLKIHGDIIAPEKFNFCIECKKGYNKENIDSILNPGSEFWKFIRQSEKDSENSGRKPMIIYQQDRKPILAITSKDIFTNINNYIEFKEYRLYLLNDILKEENTYWFNQY